jgi:hypothetical protein
MRFSKIWAVTAVFTLVLSFFFLVLPTTTVSAANTCTWTGGGGDWSDPDNWTGCDDDVPGVDDTAVINSGNPVVGGDASVGSVTVGTNGGLTIDDGATLTIIDTFSQNNEIDGEGDMIIQGHWYWLRGHHSGSGETTLSAGGQMTITLNTSTQLNRTIINNGEALWNQQGISSFAGDGLFINNGIFTVVHDATFNFASFDNQGSFIKTGSSGVVSFNANRFTNDGSVSVEAGTLYLQGSTTLADPVDSGSYMAEPGALLRFGNVNRTLTAASSVTADQILVSSGSLTIHGDYDVTTTATDGSGTINWQGNTPYSLPVLDHDGVSIGGDAPLLIEQEFIWRNGNINGTSPMTITNAALFNISLVSSSQLNRMVVNEGTAVWSSGNLTSFNFGLGTLVNNNLFTTSHSANATAFAFNLVNNGRFVKTGGANLRFNNNPTAQNNGEIHVAAGSLTFAGGLDNYASNTLSGGAFVITGTLQIQNADIQTNQADVALHTANAALQNSAPVPTDGLANFAENGADGRFALRYGAAITLPHTFTNSGELIAGPESRFTSDGYEQTGSSATTTIELAGSSASGQYGRIDAGPQATLAGTFQVGYLNGFVPDPMDSYVVIDFAQRNGTFASFDGLFIGGSQVVTVAVNPTTVVINGIGIDPPEPAFRLYLPLIVNP